MSYFDYEPMTEEQCEKARYQLLPDGFYKGKIEDAISRQSSKGNPMAELTEIFYDDNGNSKKIKDFLPFTKGMMWKCKHYCDSVNLTTEYLNKQFSPEISKDRVVYALIGIEKGKEIPFDKLNGKPFGSLYPDKNIIKDYVTSEFYESNKGNIKLSQLNPIAINNESEEDIPF